MYFLKWWHALMIGIFKDIILFSNPLTNFLIFGMQPRACHHFKKSISIWWGVFFVFLSIIVIKVNKHILLKKLISCPGYWHFDFHWFSSKNTKEMFSYFKINFWRLNRHFWGLCRSYDPPTCGVYLGGSKKQNNFLKIFFKLENGILIFFWNPLYFQKIQRISKKTQNAIF